MITVRVFCDVDAAPVDRPTFPPVPPATLPPPPKISAATPPSLVEYSHVGRELVVDPHLAPQLVGADDVGRAEHLRHFGAGHPDPDFLLDRADRDPVGGRIGDVGSMLRCSHASRQNSISATVAHGVNALTRMFSPPLLVSLWSKRESFSAAHRRRNTAPNYACAGRVAIVDCTLRLREDDRVAQFVRVSVNGTRMTSRSRSSLVESRVIEVRRSVRPAQSSRSCPRDP